MTENINVNRDNLWASVGFMIAVFIALMTTFVLFSEAPLLCIPILGLAYRVFMIGGQRTHKLKISEKLLNQRVMWLGSGVAIFTPLVMLFTA